MAGSPPRMRAWRGCIAFALLLGACTGSLAPIGENDLLPAFRDVLGQRAAAAFGVAPGREPAPLPTSSALWVVDPNWRLPDAAWSEPQLAALRQFLAGGGTVVLFGHAAALAADLGVEPEAPEQQVYRWGFDRRALVGTAALGFGLVSANAATLLRGVAEEPPHRTTIAGGQPCTAPLCSWSVGEPRAGEVLGRLAVQEDGRAQSLGAPVLVQWQAGPGRVIACGVLPEPGHADPLIRSGARSVLAALAALSGARVMLWRVVDRGVARDPLDREDGIPNAPLLAHWGWQVALREDDAEVGLRPVAEIASEVLGTSWCAGADVVEFGLSDAAGGALVEWSERDRIERPVSWRGAGGATGAVHALAEEAHARGMLALGGVDPLPVGDRAGERAVALRFLARELAGLRRLGDAALDGFGLRQWWPDRGGVGVAVVQDYQPAAILYGSGELLPPFAGALRGVDADDGAPAGGALAGVGGGWRDGFAGDLFPIGVLDARARADRWPGVGVRGGGSFGDWLVLQWNDFVRARRGLGGVALWRRFDPRTLGPATIEFVHGLGLEPLYAAVATSLATTGEGGVRAAAARLLPAAVPGFGAAVRAPAAVHVLQNNWFRLLGSGGELRFDAGGEARFEDATNVLSAGFLHTRLSGSRPDPAAVRSEQHDFLAGARRGPGGYGASTLVGRSVDVVGAPALLAIDRRPEWPARVVFEWQASPGLHELALGLRPAAGSSLVAVWLDDVLLRCVAVGEDIEPDSGPLPVHVADGGRRLLAVEVLDGGAVALDRLRVQRVGDVGVEARAEELAGCRAVLRERSCSSYHRETVRLIAQADAPALVIEVHTERAARSLQVERRIALPGYRPVGAPASDEPLMRVQPFLLRHDESARPDLVVVPMQLARYEQISAVGAEQGGGLVWRSAPEAGAVARVGVWLCPHGRGADLLPVAARLLQAIACPESVLLGPDGEATLYSDMPVPWSRVLHLVDESATPFLVEERGYWSWRGCQPAPEGGVYVRVNQSPGETLRLIGGTRVLARTRPGRGSLRTVVLREPTPLSATACVVQLSRLSAPSVDFADDFADVLLDGQPWSWFDRRRVFLPDRPGRYRIECRQHTGPTAPHVRSTAAPLSGCAYDPVSRELVLTTSGAAGRPTELPWTAVLAGPRPRSIENGEVVATDRLHLPDAAVAAAAERGGVLIRFGNGITRVQYGEQP